MSRVGIGIGSLSRTALALCLVGALLGGSARAADAEPVTISAKLTQNMGGLGGLGGWYADPYSFTGSFTAAGAVSDTGTAYVSFAWNAGGVSLVGANGVIGISLTSDDGSNPYLQTEGAWKIANATGDYAGLEGSGTYAAKWTLVFQPWVGYVQTLELELKGLVRYPEPEPDDGGDEPAPAKPGKGKKK
jgi:hypothetical protein